MFVRSWIRLTSFFVVNFLQTPTKPGNHDLHWRNLLKIAIVGSGISGLTAARQLSPEHSVTVFEAADHVGGHVNTQSVELEGQRLDIDTGFIVFNDRTYPNFCRLIDELGVESQPTSMSFSVRCDSSGCEYNGTSINGLFAQRINMFRPSFLRMLRDILKFNQSGPKELERVPEDETVADYLARNRFSREFVLHYLLPMGAAIWSCPVSQFEQFPIHFILQFYQNHGLLSLTNRPQWKVIRGGSRSYVERMTEPFKDRIRLRCPVISVSRDELQVNLTHRFGTEQFDEIIFACHSDQALKILADADCLERELLLNFPYSTSIATLHTDTSVLPRNRRAWASWNYHVPVGDQTRPTLTYNMNFLQGISSKHTFCVTLNEEQQIDPGKIIKTFRYEHPVFTVNRAKVQQRHHELIRRNRTSFCGAYWRNGFHEDGLVSALRVCHRYSSVESLPLTLSSEVARC